MASSLHVTTPTMDRSPQTEKNNSFLSKESSFPWGQKEHQTFSYTFTSASQMNNITFTFGETPLHNDTTKCLLITQESWAYQIRLGNAHTFKTCLRKLMEFELQDSTVSAMWELSRTQQTEPLERLRLCQWYVHLGDNFWAEISTTNFHMTLKGQLERMTWSSKGVLSLHQKQSTWEAEPEKSGLGMGWAGIPRRGARLSSPLSVHLRL